MKFRNAPAQPLLKNGFLIIAAILCATALPGRATDFGVFSTNENWRLLKGTVEASTPDTSAWRSNAFNDAAFTTVPAPFWYDVTGDTSTRIGGTRFTDMQNGYLSFFLRKPFVITNHTQIGTLHLGASVDDGFVAWINGYEVLRVNPPPEPFTINSSVTAAAGEPVLFTFFDLAYPTNYLVAGTNVLAVQVFNAGIASSDVDFDASLSATIDDVPPAVVNIDPPAGSTVGTLMLINVVFNEAVSGVNASDLLINTVPATGLSVISPIEYIFTFAQPATGMVSVAFAMNPGIVDYSGNAFAGASWSYTFNTNAAVAPAIISEFLANNNNGISDEDGTRSDWIEIYNPGPTDLNLDGWFLTDISTDLTKWRLPSINLNANKYLLVWASEKNRTNPAAPLHTNFKLDAAGEYLALVDPNTNVVSSFAPVYPSQLGDVSYGRVTGSPNTLGFFTSPTPGAQNSTSGSGFASEPGFSLASGIYTNNTLTLTLTSPPLSVIRYTFDGSVPTTGSPGGASPQNITFATNMMIQVRVFQTNQPSLFPSPVGSRTFVLLDTTTANFSSDLPLLVISTQGRGIQENLAPGSARQRGTFVALDTFQGRSSMRCGFLGKLAEVWPTISNPASPWKSVLPISELRP